MSPSTKRLHQTLIRLLKGCLTSWETWLYQQPVDGPSPTSEQSTTTSTEDL